MHAMRLLATSGVTMAAGAMISLSFAVSPPLILLPPLPVPIDANGDVASETKQTAETVGAAIADSFERRWQATDDIRPIPVSMHDSLRGLIGGVVPMARDATQAGQVDPHDLYTDRAPARLVPPRPASIDIMSGSAG